MTNTLYFRCLILQELSNPIFCVLIWFKLRWHSIFSDLLVSLNRYACRHKICYFFLLKYFNSVEYKIFQFMSLNTNFYWIWLSSVTKKKTISCTCKHLIVLTVSTDHQLLMWWHYFWSSRLLIWCSFMKSSL